MLTGRPNGQRRSCLQCACRAINDGFSLVLAGSSTARDAETLETGESDFAGSWGYFASVRGRGGAVKGSVGPVRAVIDE